MRAVGVSAVSVRRKRRLERDAPRQLVAPQLQLEQAKAARERLELERKRESFLARGTELKGHVTRILEVVDADNGVDDLRQVSDEQLADLRSAITAVQHQQQSGRGCILQRCLERHRGSRAWVHFSAHVLYEPR